MEDITKLEDELQSLGGIVTYQKNRPSSVTIEVNTLNTYLHKACNQAYKNGFKMGEMQTKAILTKPKGIK